MLAEGFGDKVARRKLIEVSLPLSVINDGAGQEKNPFLKAHPRNLHLWWARRPLAACRAVLFASLVDDPSSDPDRFPTPKAVEDERTRLFGMIERLVQWENSSNEVVLEEARAEIRRSTGGSPPAVLDPFCGGGSIPLEAQRLGLSVYASDLNPVAVLITKALVEIPPKFVDRAPVHPNARRGVGASGTWEGAAGLAEDVRRYGGWMRDEAERRVGHLYPTVRLPTEHGGGEATVIAWLWARTVVCPNPACGAKMPLVRSFELSKKKGREAWIVPVIDRDKRTVSFSIGGPHGHPSDPPKTGRGANFRCLVCEQVSPDEHIKAEGRAKRIGTQLLAIVAEGPRGRVYLAPNVEHARIAESAEPEWGPDQELANDPRALWTVNYGLSRFRDLFTPRQLVALTTLTDLVSTVRGRVLTDAIAAGLPDDGESLKGGGTAASAYADAIAIYLSASVSQASRYHVSLCTWNITNANVAQAFGRQAIPMTWDYAEANPLAGPLDFSTAVGWVAGALGSTPPHGEAATVSIADATSGMRASNVLISTDPPYYDNIGYADLADFFYVWLRRALSDVEPDLFGTVVTPKSAELIATPYRFGGDRRAADRHFEMGLRRAFASMRTATHPTYPVTVYYAFKQAESEGGDGGLETVASTGWETMLEALLRSGFSIGGTWPIRTERVRGLKSNIGALASSIVLVCRPRPVDAGITTRKDFVANLKRELPDALRTLQQGSIAPVDLAQSSIGPGMAIFSRYAKVLEPDGSAMRVRTALALINQVLDETLAEQEGEFDTDTRWAIAWYEQFGLSDADFGSAETLSKAKNSSVAGLVEAGIVAASRSRVRLLARHEYSANWDPSKDTRVPVWEATQRLVQVLLTDGEASAGDLLARLGGLGDTARDLAYRMYHVAERKGWTDEAQAYNALVVAWTDLARSAESSRATQPAQATLGLE
jgi:putative DNA methylase